MEFSIFESSSPPTPEEDELCQLKEESRLTDWLNTQLSPPSPCATVLTRRLHQTNLLEDCAAVRCQLEQTINWTRHLLKESPSLKSVWLGRIRSLLAPYRECWLQLALVAVQFGLFGTNQQSTSTTNRMVDTRAQLVQLVVSSSSAKPNARSIAIKLLTVVHFLDQAKHRALVLPHQPSLFVAQQYNPNSNPIYSSEAVLTRFMLTCLTPGASGQFKAELLAIQYQVQQVECPAELSVRFTIHQLATELCDGIRLAKVSEILFAHERPILVRKLKYPANGSAEQVANMTHLFSTFLWDKLTRYDPSSWPTTVHMLTVAKEVALAYRATTIRVLYSLQQIRLKVTLEHHYLQYLPVIVRLQRRVKAWIEAKRARAHYIALGRVTSWVQQHYRAKLAARKARAEYVQLRTATLTIQRRFRLWRNVKSLREHIQQYLDRRQAAAITIQRHWRGVTTRWRDREVHGFDLIDRIVAIEMNKADLGIRESIGTKTEHILRRLQAHKQIKQVVQGGGSSTKLLNDLMKLHQFVHWSVQIRGHILSHHCNWLLIYFGTVLQSLNRSEQHKLIAHHLLQIVHYLASPLKSVQLECITRQQRAQWSKLASALIHLMQDYINYPKLMHQALSILALLTEREQRVNCGDAVGALSMHAQEQNGDEQGSIGALLAHSERLWQRLMARMKDKYRVEVPSATETDQHCHTLTTSTTQTQSCSCCHSVKSEFSRLLEMVKKLSPAT